MSLDSVCFVSSPNVREPIHLQCIHDWVEVLFLHYERQEGPHQSLEDCNWHFRSTN